MKVIMKCQKTKDKIKSVFEYYDELADEVMRFRHLSDLEKYLKEVLLLSNESIDDTVIYISILQEHSHIIRHDFDVTIREARRYKYE